MTREVLRAEGAVERSPLVNRRPLMSRRRRRRWIALATALLVVAGVGTFYVIGKRATPVPVDTAVARYREAVVDAARTAPKRSAIAPAVPSEQAGRRAAATAAHDAEASQVRPPTTTAKRVGDAVPTPGVYVYSTEGYEEVSVLGGARHTYPDQTTITVTRTACGADLRWDGLEQRWDEWTTCAAGHAIRWREFLTYHEFFKQVDRKHYLCSPTTLLRPARDTIGAAFTGRCTGSGATIDMSGRVVGLETVKVGSTTVRAVRVRIEERPSGATKGRRTYDSWYQVGTNLLVRRDSHTDVDSKSAFGYTHYVERLSLTLTTLEPRR